MSKGTHKNKNSGGQKIELEELTKEGLEKVDRFADLDIYKKQKEYILYDPVRYVRVEICGIMGLIKEGIFKK